MNETDISDRSDLNSGNEWSEMDLFVSPMASGGESDRGNRAFPMPVTAQGAREGRRA
jgi:hypothetical protein